MLQLRQRWQMILCIWASYRLENQDVDGALRLIARASSVGDLTPAQIAFKGMAMLIARRFDEAEVIWHEVVGRFGSDLSPDVRYAFLYARARLHALGGNDAMCARDERDASMLRCSRLIKERLLPGPDLIEANDR